jgi:hypothetical protein
VAVSEKQTLTIAKAKLEVTARDTSRVQGAANPVFTFKYKGFVGTDGPDVLDTKMSATCTATATSASGTYKIFPVAVVDNNYEITVVSGTLTVTPKTGVDNLLADNVEVYPNPTPDKFKISMPGLSSKLSVEIYSFTGKLVMLEQLNAGKPEVNISALAPGVYIVKIITPKGVLLKQIVKQ